MTLRILVTGSRAWTDWTAIRRALEEVIDAAQDRDVSLLREEITVVHGDARGADRIAGKIAAALGCTVEVHPANWTRYGKSAGIIRNLEMIRLGADVVLAFPLGPSRGTRQCMAAAKAAGITVQNCSEQVVMP